METKNLPKFDDRERMTDLLSTEKMLAGVYNTFCAEAANAPVRNCLCNLLTDEHRIGDERPESVGVDQRAHLAERLVRGVDAGERAKSLFLRRRAQNGRKLAYALRRPRRLRND